MLTAEEFLMLIITGVTNVACIPALYLLYAKRMYFQVYLGIFTFITSFLYHSMESVHIKAFYLNSGGWHRLDNIAAIMCFITLFIYLMDNLQKSPKDKYKSVPFCDTDLMLNMLGLFITLTM
jgi:hypothetical protein